MRTLLTTLFLLCTLTLGSAWAQSDTGTVGVAWDPQGLECERTVAPGTVGTFYLLAYLTGWFAGSTTGAEFRLDGFPPEWYVISVTPSPQAVVTVGNPLTGGCNIAFASCQTGTAAVALLYSVQFYAANAVTQRVLSVHGHMHPSNSEFPCPMLVGCDEPCFCFGCSNGGTAAINYPGYCAVAVEPRSWTSVRALYR